jgi:hypothetical protein
MASCSRREIPHYPIDYCFVDGTGTEEWTTVTGTHYPDLAKGRTGTVAGYAPGGVKVFEGHYLTGKPHGLIRHWSRRGSLVGEQLYEDGLPNGPSTRYSTSGHRLVMNTYSNGVLHGRSVQWSRDGRRAETNWFEQGRLVPKKAAEQSPGG